ncbi:MAG: metallophosphoesterase [Burkholderiales bacterium]|jgi:predicted MPP superfamily phosphohydrolase|nr:metallophosphoesterase [Burkholderiales bacterium]
MSLFVLSLLFTLLAGIVLWWCIPVGLRKAWWFFCGVAVGIHLLWMFGRAEGSTLWMTTPFMIVTIMWSVTMALLTATGVLFLVLRWLYRKVLRSPQLPDRERRLLLSAAPVITMSVAASSVAATGVVNAGKPFEVRHVDIPLKHLPAAFDGFRIGQLSDVHVANFITPAYLRQAVAALDEAGVDVQVMTGDLIDDLSQIDETFEALLQCRATHGTVCVLGNHERRHIDPIMAAYTRYGASGRLHLLVDQSMCLAHEGETLAVVGVDYPMSASGSHMPPKEKLLRQMEASAQKAFAGIAAGENALILCLTHHPDFFRFSAARGAALTLAGHTHGGQWSIGKMSFAELFDYPLGYYRLDDAHLYVSGGTGHLLPFRIGVPTEVTVLTLRQG